MITDTYCKGLFCLKKTVIMLLFLCIYMNKTLPTLGNEKEQQIKFYKKLLDKLIFSWATKNLKMFNFTCLTGQMCKK